MVLKKVKEKVNCKKQFALKVILNLSKNISFNMKVFCDLWDHESMFMTGSWSIFLFSFKGYVWN